MSDGDWRPVAALGGLIAFLFLSASYERFTEYQRQHVQERISAAEDDAGASRHSGTATCTNVPRTNRMTCSFESEQANAPDKHAEADLRAQQDMAEWAFGMLLVGFASLAVTAVGVFYVAETLRQTREANVLVQKQSDAAQRAAEEAERPLFFVSINETAWRPRPPGSGAFSAPPTDIDVEEREEIALHVDLRNVGTRPAFGVALDVVLGFLGADERWVVDVHEVAELGVKVPAGRFMTFKSERGPILERMRNGELLRVGGRLLYDDVLGVRRERGFYFQAHERRGLAAYWSETPLDWIRIADDRFNYDRRVEKQPS